MAKVYENFFTIEGGDGSGKGTQAELIHKYVTEDLGKFAVKLSFPRYGEPSAYYAEQYLNGAYGGPNDVPADLGVLPYAIDRFAAKADVEAALTRPNSVVISDRYMGSNLAHQGTKLDDPEERRAFYERTLHLEYDILGIPRPAKNIVLLVPSAVSQENVDKKAARSYTALKRDIHEADVNHLEKAKRNYEELCELYPEEFIAINCMNEAGDAMRSIEEIQAEIRLAIGFPGVA